MTAGLSEKMTLALTRQRKLARKMPWIANIIFVPLVLFWFGELTLLSGSVSFITSFVGGRIILLIYAQYQQIKIYGNNIDEYVKDLQHAVDLEEASKNGTVDLPGKPGKIAGTREFSIDIVEKAEKSNSKYKDFPIYDWVMVKWIDGNIRKFVFDGVVNLDGDPTKKLILPQNSFVLGPGIIYKLDESQVDAS